jgi:hypothetical protein
MASFLEDWVRPRVLLMRRAALRVWAATMNRWAVEDESLDSKGYDTERLERLIDLAWASCRAEIGIWDSRFALQSLRSLPPEIVNLTTQSVADPSSVAGIIRIATAAAATLSETRWLKGVEVERNYIQLTPEQSTDIAQQSPKVLGGCIGAAHLMYQAQGWYRWVGKGQRLISMPKGVSSVDFPAIEQWDGTEIFIMPAPMLNEDPLIERSVFIYENRRDAMSGGRQSGILRGHEYAEENNSSNRMWYARWRGVQAPLPVHVPSFDLTFPTPAWYPLPDLRLTEWIEQLRPFNSTLRERIRLDCDELTAGLTALRYLIERQTQCGFLEDGKWNDSDALLLKSPAEKDLLWGALGHLASILLRGTLRASVEVFIRSLSLELELIGWQQPEQLAERFIHSLSGSPEPHGLPSPSLFYITDPLTCVLDLSLWHSFTDACLAVATYGDGDIGSRRGRLFEEQVRNRLIKALKLDQSDIPWPANRVVLDGQVNLGDVDFCFVRHEILFNLDMKSWQHSSDYIKGHYHTIKKRLQMLETQLRHVENRGRCLQDKLKSNGCVVADRLDFIIVAFPEYLALDSKILWYGDHPRVVTVGELIDLVSRPEVCRELRRR